MRQKSDNPFPEHKEQLFALADRALSKRWEM
jgi:hypothetical protein